MLTTPRFLGVSMALQKSRRLLVIATYAVPLTCFACSFMRPWAYETGALAGLLGVFLIPLVLFVFNRVVNPTLSGHRQGGTTRLGPTSERHSSGELDERELAIRNAAHYQAFRVMELYSLLLVVSFFYLRPLNGPVANQLAALFVLLLLLMLWTLPQAIILWTEPDMPEEDRVYNSK